MKVVNVKGISNSSQLDGSFWLHTVDPGCFAEVVNLESEPWGSIPVSVLQYL